jgi:plasmid stabilization system protein ParE
VKYSLRTSRRADADIDRQVAYIHHRVSPLSAARWHDGLLRRIRELVQRPEVWPLAEEAVEIGLDLREMLYRRHRFVYRILYTIEGDIVRIHRIHSASQDRLSSDDMKP